jgi:uncharacterized protein involved in exopolysaccharide biosynthesis
MLSRLLRALAVPMLTLPLLAGLLAFAATYLFKPQFTATTTFLPPQQQQSAAASALAALGSIGSLAGVGAAVRSPADLYVALMQSASVSDRLIDEFKLMAVYEAETRTKARRELAKSVTFTSGRKDGLIRIDVSDTSADRAAAIANKFVAELRQMTNDLAVTEAQQRRQFFERQLKAARDSLVAAQLALQSSGFNTGALKSEPKAAAESYARSKAELAGAEIRLEGLRSRLSETTPEIQQVKATIAALRQRLVRAEQAEPAPQGPDYVSRYRDFKYQEAMFELYARQFELARADESREGALIQVVDPAVPAELKSFPKRGVIATAAATIMAALVLLWVVLRGRWRSPTQLA